MIEFVLKENDDETNSSESSQDEAGEEADSTQQKESRHAFIYYSIESEKTRKAYEKAGVAYSGHELLSSMVAVATEESLRSAMDKVWTTLTDDEKSGLRLRSLVVPKGMAGDIGNGKILGNHSFEHVSEAKI